METANAYLDYKNKKNEDGTPVPDDTARRWAVASGALTAALSTLGPEAVEAAPALKMLTRGGLGEMMENTGLRTAVDKLLTSSIPESMLKTGAFFGGSTWGHIASGVMASSKDMSPMAILNTIFSPENNKKVLAAAGTGAAVGGTMTAGMGAWSIYTDYSKATEALNHQAAWDNVGQVRGAMKASKIAPDQVGKVTENLAGEGNVYIPLYEWQKWADEQNVHPGEAWMQATGNKNAYMESLKTGADLQMPTKTYAKVFSASEFGPAFNKVVRANPQAMNAVEAEEFLGKQAPEQQAMRTSAEKIKEEVAPTPKAPETTAMTVPEPLPAKEETPITPAPTTPEGIEAEQHIQAAQQDLGHKPLDLTGMGMTPEQEASIRAAEERAHGAAQDEMARAIVDKALKTKSVAWNQERSQVEEQVRQDLSLRRDYAALDSLKSGKTPDGAEIAKLSKPIIESDFPEVKLSDLPPGVARVENAIHPDDAAMRLGYDSGSHLLHDLATTPDKETTIQQEIDRQMIERHPDITSDTNLPEAAIRAVNNEERGKLLRKQLEHFYTKEFAAAKGLMSRVAGHLPNTEALKADVARDISTKTYKELSPQLYLQGMTLAEKGAERASKSGEIQNMIDHRRAEERNFHMYRAAQKAKDTINKRIDKVDGYSKKLVQEMLGKAGGTFREDVNNLLANPDFQNYKAMPYGRLMDYLDQIDSKVHEARAQGKIYAEEKFDTVDKARTAILYQIQDNFPAVKEQVSQFPKPTNLLETNFIPKLVAYQLNIENVANEIDNYKADGLIKHLVTDPINGEAAGKQAELVDKHINTLPKYNYTKMVDDIEGHKMWYAKSFYIPEIDMSLIKPQMIRIARLRQNDYTWKAFLDGYGLTDAQGMAVISMLSNSELDLVDGMSKNFEASKAEAFAIRKRKTGIEPESVKPSPYEVTLKDGTVRKMDGGYTPLTFDSELTLGANEEDPYVKNFFSSKPSDANLRNRTNPGGRAPSLDLNSEMKVLGKILHYTAYAEPLENAQKILGDKAIQAHIIAAVGKQKYDLFEPWLKDVAGNNPIAVSPMDHMYSVGKNAVMIVKLGWKTTSELKHLNNYGMVINELGPEYAAKGMKVFYKNPLKVSEMWENIKNKSPYMRQMATHLDKDISDAANRLNIGGDKSIFGDTLLGKLSNVKTAYMHDFTRSLFYLYGVSYTSIAAPSWYGGYLKALDGEVEGIGKMDEKAAISYADRVVRTKIVSGNTADLAAVLRDKGVQKYFNWYFRPSSLRFNDMYENWSKFNKSKKMPDDIAKYIGAEFLGRFIPAILSGLIGSQLPKGAKGVKKLAIWGVEQVASGYAELTPWTRFLPRAIETKGHEWNDPLFGTLTELTKAGFDLGHHAMHHARWTTKEIKEVGVAAGYFTGLPSQTMMDSWAVAHDWLATHHYHPSSVVSGLWHVATGKEPRK